MRSLKKRLERLEEAMSALVDDADLPTFWLECRPCRLGDLPYEDSEIIGVHNSTVKVTRHDGESVAELKTRAMAGNPSNRVWFMAYRSREARPGMGHMEKLPEVG